MNKKAGMDFSLEKLIKIILSVIVFLVIILFPIELYGYYAADNEADQKDSMNGLGSEMNELLFDLSRSSLQEKEMTIPFRLFKDYVVQGISYNNIACNKDSSCICLVSIINPEKKFGCQNFKDAQMLTTGEIYFLEKDDPEEKTANIRVIMKKTDAKITIEAYSLEKKEDEAAEDTEVQDPSIGSQVCLTAEISNSKTTITRVTENYGQIIKAKSATYGIPEEFLIAIISQESGGRFYALSCKNNEIGCGAGGLGQMMPLVASKDFRLKVFNPYVGTEKSVSDKCDDEYTRRLVAKAIDASYEDILGLSCAQYRQRYYDSVKKMTPEQLSEKLGGDDRFIPEKIIEASAKYLSQLLNQFGGDQKLAAAAYNAGAQRVKTACCPDDICAFNDDCCRKLPKETNNEYVPKVLAYNDAITALG